MADVIQSGSSVTVRVRSDDLSFAPPVALPPGATPTVTDLGDDTDHILQLGLPSGLKGDKGEPGSGGSSISIGLFTDIGSITVPIGTDLIQTSGHHIVGVGPAQYARVASNPNLPGAWQAQDASGSYFKIVVSGFVDAQQFGCVADAPAVRSFAYTNYTATLAAPVGATDNLPILKQIWSGLPKFPRTGSQHSGSLVPIVFCQPDATKAWFFSNTIVPPYAVRVEATGSGHDAAGLGQQFRFPPNTAGLRLNHWSHQVLDGNAATMNEGFDTAGSVFQGIWFQGGGGTDDSAHGVMFRSYCDINECVFDGFAGKGGYNLGQTFDPVGSYNYGITSGSKHRGNVIRQCRCEAWHAQGSDVSASSFRDLHLKSSGLAGLIDTGYFNNDYEGLNIHGHGGRVLGACFDEGYNYALISQGVNAGQVKPKDNPTIWQPTAAAASASPTRFPQWSADGNYVLSLPAYIGGSTRVIAYIENYYLPAHTYNNAFFCGGENAYTQRSAGLRHDGTSGFTISRQPFGFERRYVVPHPVWGAFARSALGSRTGGTGDPQEGLVQATRASEGGIEAPWMLWGAISTDYYREGFGVSANGFGDTSRVTSFDTTLTLGRATGKVMKQYRVAMRWALGNPSNGNTQARAFFTTAGAPSGTDRAQGERGFNITGAIGGIAGWVAMGDGTVQPVGIIGAVRAASVAPAAGSSPTKAEFDALITSLKNAGLMA